MLIYVKLISDRKHQGLLPRHGQVVDLDVRLLAIDDDSKHHFVSGMIVVGARTSKSPYASRVATSLKMATCQDCQQKWRQSDLDAFLMDIDFC